MENNLTERSSEHEDTLFKLGFAKQEIKITYPDRAVVDAVHWKKLEKYKLCSGNAADLQATMRALEVARGYLWHKNQCDYVTSFAKDCDCGYNEALKTIDEILGKS